MPGIDEMCSEDDCSRWRSDEPYTPLVWLPSFVDGIACRLRLDRYVGTTILSSTVQEYCKSKGIVLAEAATQLECGSKSQQAHQ